MKIVFFILTLILFIILISTINVELKDIYIRNIGNIGSHFEIKIYLALFGKIKYFSLTIKDKKLRKIFESQKEKSKTLTKRKKEKRKEKAKIIYEQLIKNRNLKIEKLYLNAKIGYPDIIATSFCVGGVSIVLSMILPYFVPASKEDKCFYIITPIYEEKNLFDINLESIFSVKMIHIIYIIYIFLKQKGKKKKYERTSNRKPYEYGYE